MANLNCKRDLGILAMAMFISMSANTILRVIQSSINQQLGTIALSVNPALHMFSVIVISPLAMNKFGCKKMIIFGNSMQAVYVVANYYPEPYTLIPAAALMGIGSGVMWPSIMYYISALGKAHALKRKHDIDKTTGMFYGLFYGFVSLCFIFGGASMSIIQQVKGNLPEFPDVATPGGFNSTTPTQVTTTPSQGKNASDSCGLYHALAVGKSEEHQLSPLVTYILMSFLLALDVLAITLCFFIKESNLNCTSRSDESKFERSSMEISLTTIQSNKLLNEDETRIEAERKGRNQNVLTKLYSSFRLLKNDKAALLMIIMTIHYGCLQNFVGGTFNASWITCSLGVEYVAYTTVSYGCVLSIGCMSFGRLIRYTSHVKIFTGSMILESAILVTLLLWQPADDASNEKWLFFVLSAGFALSLSSQSGQLASVYSRFFSDRESSAVLLCLWDPLGAVLAYLFTSLYAPIVLVILQLCLCVVGTLLYFAAEWIKLNERKKTAAK